MRFEQFISVLTLAHGSYAATADKRSNLPACPPRKASSWEQLYIWNAFVDEFFVQANYTKALTNFVWIDYIQHNPRAGQGRDAAIAALGPGDPNHNTTIAHSALVDNIGYVHHYEFKGVQPFKVVDVFRMNGSCVVEHWDVIANLTLGEINPTPLAS